MLRWFTGVMGFAARLLPPGRADLVAGVVVEALSVPGGRARRRWLLGVCWFVVKEGVVTYLKLASVAGSALFILWIFYNGMDSGWSGTGPEIASYLGVMVLLGLNIALTVRGLLVERRD